MIFLPFQSENGLFMIPYDAELECKQNIVVYDSNTKELVGASKCSLSSFAELTSSL